MKRFAFYIFVLLCTLTIGAQNTRLITTQNGLISSDISSIDIDSHGVAWLSGVERLGYFDGTHVSYLSSEQKNTPSYLYFSGIREQSEGIYWAMTGSGLYLYDSHNNRFDRFRLYEESDTLIGPAISHILPMRKGLCRSQVEEPLLVVTSGYGNYVIDNKTKTIDDKATKAIQNVINGYQTAPFIDADDNLWVEHINRKLVCLSLRNLQYQSFDMTAEADQMLQTYLVTGMVQQRSTGNIYIATIGGLLKYERSSNNISVVSDAPRVSMRAIKQLANGDILIGTDSYGLYLLAGDGHISKYEVQNLTYNLSAAKVVSICEDANGNILVSLLQKGILVIPRHCDIFRYHAISPSGDGRNTSCITGMTVDSKNNYWIGTDGSGLFTTNGLHLATAHQVPNDGLRSSLIQSVIADRQDRVWIGSYGGGVQCYSSGRFVTPVWAESMKNMLVMSMSYDKKENKLYVGTNGEGVYCLDLTKEETIKIEPQGLPTTWISNVLVDDGTLYIAYVGGYGKYNLKTKKLTVHPVREPAYGTINGLAISKINGRKCLLVCSNGGLDAVWADNGKTEHIIKGERIEAIEENDDDLWASTSNCILCINKKTLASPTSDEHKVDIKRYTSFAGFFLGEFHHSSSLSPLKDDILFGADNGIICFTPSLIKHSDKMRNQLCFTRLQVGDEIVNYSEGNDFLSSSILYADEITLSSNHNSFSIAFSVMELASPSSVKYEYFLKGYDKEWHQAGDDCQASYSSLPSGSYLLMVRAYYEGDESNVVEREIKVIVHYPWYWSWPMRLVYLLLLAGLCYLLYNISKTKKLHRKELIEAERRESLKEEKLRLFTSITHELRSPLMMIEAPLKQLIETDSDEEHQNLYSIMERNSDRLLSIVKQITDIRNIDSGKLELHLEQHDYVEYADEVFMQFKGVATVKQISFIVEHREEELPMMFDHKHFEKILTNLLSNAFKFTPDGGKVIVRSSLVGNNVELRFYNSGSHIDEDDRAHLFERFYQGKNNGTNVTSTADNHQSEENRQVHDNSDLAGSGIGLNLVYELVKLHGGTIECNNIDPDGVEFTLHFPYYHGKLVSYEGEDISLSSEPVVLVVDDDNELRSFVTEQLKKDCCVVAAKGGREGWQLVLKHRPDVVITDYKMPEGDGIELCRLIKSNPETDSTPVIMLTGEGSEQLQLHSLNLQVDHYLEKPVNMIMLRGAINQVLRVRENLRNKVRRTDIGMDYSNVKVVNTEEKFYGKVNEAIKKHLTESEYGVQELSDEVGISRAHLNRKIKERYGVTPSFYIKSYRLKQAAYLLVHNKVNVSEVAYATGFSSHTYFTSSFREYFGMSPKEFILQYGSGENSEALEKLLE